MIGLEATSAQAGAYPADTTIVADSISWDGSAAEAVALRPTDSLAALSDGRELPLVGMFGKPTDETCVVCLSSPATTMVLPCRHLVLCDGCLGPYAQHTTTLTCPKCRGEVERIVKLSA
jgi:hypothetical protein